MTSRSLSYWKHNAPKIRKIVAGYMPIYRKVCERYPSMNFPERFESLVQEQVPNYVDEIPYHPGGRRNMFNSLMPVLAMMASVHVVLRESGWTVDQIGRLSYEVFMAKFRRIPSPVRRIARNFMVSRWFGKKMGSTCRAMKESGRSDTFFLDYSFSSRPEATTTMRCSQCGMISFMRRTGLTEMYDYCNIFDFAQADSFGMGLNQSECLGWGDGVCVYTMTRNSTATRYPRNVKRILGAAMDM